MPVLSSFGPPGRKNNRIVLWTPHNRKQFLVPPEQIIPKWRQISYSLTIRGPAVGYSSRTSMTTSRTANSSCVACDDVVTLLRTTVPASISSASLRRAAMALVSLSPKACLPARSAHSAAWMLVLPPLIMFFFPLLLKKNVLPTVPCLKNSHI